jgi:1,4-dihydroxy-2-naphthoate octaprenyltransferase
MARLGAWVQASRPLAQINVAAPLIYGQALAYAAHGAFRWKLALLLHLFGLLDHLFIVYSNDIADFPSDASNTTFNRYSGGSRVIARGLLRPMDLAVAATLALLAMGAVAGYLVFSEQRVWMVVMAAMAAHLLWMYSFPPFRLSYRGQGEVLQGLGLGVLLPVMGYYVQVGTLAGFSPSTVLPAFLLGYAGNLTTALPDAPSDAATGKRTYAVRRGERAARRASLVVLAVAALATPLAVPGVSGVAIAAIVAAAAVILRGNLRLVATADATEHSLCERFVTTNGAAITVLLGGWTLALVVMGGH